MALAHCILGKFLGVGCHCFPPPLDVPTFSARCLHVQRRERLLAAEGGTLRGRELFRQISSRIRLPRNSRDLLHAVKLRHGTDGFTSPPKEGVLRIFFLPLKIRRLWPGLNPRTWVPKASTHIYIYIWFFVKPEEWNKNKAETCGCELMITKNLFHTILCFTVHTALPYTQST